MTTSCKQIEALVTPYVDGELDATSRADLDTHLRQCAPCHSRVSAESAVRSMLHARKSALQKDCAPPALRATCSGLAAGGAGVSKRKQRATATGLARTFTRPSIRMMPLAVAASLIMIVGAFVYELTDRSARVMAAELTADHLKCFGLINPILRTHDLPSSVEGALASSFNWPVRLPDRPERAGLELVGARPCLYGEGRVAHIMYRHNGHAVSVFMLPKATRPEEVVEVLGHEAVIWSTGDRTFVLIAREPRAEVERMASFVHASLR